MDYEVQIIVTQMLSYASAAPVRTPP
jgi:hypothetical protein